VSQTLSRSYPPITIFGEVCIFYEIFQAILESICTNLRVFWFPNRPVRYSRQQYGAVAHAVHVKEDHGTVPYGIESSCYCR
jgi:hypothetical protein